MRYVVAAAAALIFMAPGESSGAVVPMSVICPTTNADSLQTPLTDLAAVLVYGQRCGRAERQLFGTLPAVGAMGDTLNFDLQIDSTGTTYEITAYAKDASGNVSPWGASCSIAVPLAQYSPGLYAEYFADSALTQLKLTKTEPNIDFDWGNGSPGASVPDDNWGARWTGKIRTMAAGTYSFRAYINNGFRLWVGGQQLMCCGSWTNPNTHTTTASIDLAGGMEYDFRAEYRDACCSAFIHLYWTPPGGLEEILPASAFVQ